MVGPILQLKNELFQTFRQRRSIVSVQEYETDKASLERMLKDFESDFAKAGQVLHRDSRKACMDALVNTQKGQVWYLEPLLQHGRLVWHVSGLSTPWADGVRQSNLPGGK